MQDLQQESEHLFEAAPSYLSSGQQAAARAEWNANSKALPPLTLYLGVRGDWFFRGIFGGNVASSNFFGKKNHGGWILI